MTLTVAPTDVDRPSARQVLQHQLPWFCRSEPCGSVHHRRGIRRNLHKHRVDAEVRASQVGIREVRTFDIRGDKPRVSQVRASKMRSWTSLLPKIPRHGGSRRENQHLATERRSQPARSDHVGERSDSASHDVGNRATRSARPPPASKAPAPCTAPRAAGPRRCGNRHPLPNNPTDPRPGSRSVPAI